MSSLKPYSRKSWISKIAHTHLVVILVALAGTAARAQTAISNCNPTVAAPAGSLINVAGDYQVTTNVVQTLPAAPCILITASDVILKLNGHQITSTSDVASGSGIEVLPSAGRLSQVSIMGPGLVGGAFLTGIYFEDADYSQVSQVTTSVTFTGIMGTNVTFLTVNSNVIAQGVETGLVLSSSTNGNVQYNEISGNQGGGILIENSSATLVGNNTVIGNGTPALKVNGISISASTGTRVYGNRTDGNSQDGIFVDNLSSGNQIFSNLASFANHNFDMEDANATCGSDLWSANAFFTASQPCIH